VRQKRARDASAGIANDDPGFTLDFGHRHVDASVIRCEFDRVVQQVPEHLLQPFRVAEHLDARRRHGGNQLNVLRVRDRFESLNRRQQRAADIDRHHFQVHRSRRQAVHVQQIVDQHCLKLRVLGNDVEN
jgi:hypothetical protein